VPGLLAPLVTSVALGFRSSRNPRTRLIGTVGVVAASLGSFVASVIIGSARWNHL
jgi:hypothetical protein